MEQEADGYRFRAKSELIAARVFRGKSKETEQRYLRLAQRDYDRARQLYEPISGYSNVSVALREVDDDDQARQQLDDTLKKPVKLAKRQHRSPNSEARPVAVTKSWEAKVLAVGTESGTPRRVAWREFAWLASTSLVVSIGLGLVYSAKTHNFGEHSSRLDHGELLDLNSVTKPEQLLPFLQIFPGEPEREAVAAKTSEFLAAHRPIRNIGALARLRVSKTEIESHPEWTVLQKQLQEQLARQQAKPQHRGELRIPLLPLAKLKPVMTVRTPREFQMQFLIWITAYFAGFYVVFLVWRWSAFRGDFSILPAVHLLTGIGLILSISLRDPLRDTLEFSKFAWGVALGCVVLLLPSLRILNYQRFSKWCYTPLFAAFLLFIGLLRFGSGPGGNDAKVNLGPFQPVEAIKILLVFFLAGYFAQNWERLRDLREKTLVPRALRWINLPRFSHVLAGDVRCCLRAGIVLPAERSGPGVGNRLFVSGDVLGGARPCRTGIARHCAAGRRRNQWDISSANQPPLWSASTCGSRPGTTMSMAAISWRIRCGLSLPAALGDRAPAGAIPAMIPAGNTDLVLPAIGEEWGFAGVAAVLLLLGYLVHRALRIGLRAPNEYGLFLALGLGALIAFEMLLISGGVLGAIPLSGVVSPFLSSGNTAMLANFLIFGILLAISNHSRAARGSIEPFRRPVRSLERALAVCTVTLLCMAAYYQIGHDREFLARDTKVFEDDGVKRPQHNPSAEFAGARNPSRRYFRPQWDSARHQRLERAGTTPRGIRKAGRQHR